MKRAITVVTDDLDGSDIPAPTHRCTTLTLDDEAVVLDLTGQNRSELRELLAPYLEAGRRVSPAAVRRVSRVTELKPRKIRAKRKRNAG